MPLDNLLQTLVSELNSANTIAIGITGSHARGDAQPYSDVDVWHFVRTMPDDPAARYTLHQRDDYLISLTHSTLAYQREKMASPGGAMDAVPGLRQMRVLLDKTGELAQVIEEARQFRWENVQAEADAFASYDLMGNAEEAHKIMNGLIQSDDPLIAFWLPWLVVGMVRVVAMHKGVLADSENSLNRQVQLAVGLDSDWTRQHRMALGLVMASPGMRGRAGLALYRETVALVQPIILPEHLPVIEATLKRITRFVE